MTEKKSQNTSSKIKLLISVLVPVAAILGIVFAGLTYLKSSQQAPQLTNEKEGDHASTISIGKTLENFEVSLFKDGQISPEKVSFSKLSAKVILINFWANWCQSCMLEMPSLVKLHEAYKDKGFEILGVNVDESPTSAIPKTLKKFNIGFLTAVDPDGLLGDLFDVHAIPFSIIIVKSDSNKIVFIESGERDWFDKEIQDKIENWLK